MRMEAGGCLNKGEAFYRLAKRALGQTKAGEGVDQVWGDRSRHFLTKR